jgi:hypothetical protein
MRGKAMKNDDRWNRRRKGFGWFREDIAEGLLLLALS